MEKIDVTAVITLHREGLLAHSTLLNIDSCRREAEKFGLVTEFVITLDNADAETIQVVEDCKILRNTDKVLPVSFGDLSSCRNHAVAHAKGNFVGTFDGDDYWSRNWIIECVRAIGYTDRSHIFHPDLMIAFGAWNAYWWQIDQSSEFYKKESLLVSNYWNACAFAAREVFEAVPYEVSRVGEEGFGFEDWHWNCETIANGYTHGTAKNTARFERRKRGGSLNNAHHVAGSVVRPTAFFGGFADV